MLGLSLLWDASRIRLPRQRRHRLHRPKQGQQDQQDQQGKKARLVRLVRLVRREKRPSREQKERLERPERREQPERLVQPEPRERLEQRDGEAGKVLLASSGLDDQKREGNATFPFLYFVTPTSHRSKTTICFFVTASLGARNRVRLGRSVSRHQ